MPPLVTEFDMDIFRGIESSVSIELSEAVERVCSGDDSMECYDFRNIATKTSKAASAQQQHAQTPAMVHSSNYACTFPIEDAPTLTTVRVDFNTVSSPVSTPNSRGKHRIVTSLEW